MVEHLGLGDSKDRFCVSNVTSSKAPVSAASGGCDPASPGMTNLAGSSLEDFIILVERPTGVTGLLLPESDSKGTSIKPCVCR